MLTAVAVHAALTVADPAPDSNGIRIEAHLLRDRHTHPVSRHVPTCACNGHAEAGMPMPPACLTWMERNTRARCQPQVFWATTRERAALHRPTHFCHLFMSPMLFKLEQGEFFGISQFQEAPRDSWGPVGAWMEATLTTVPAALLYAPPAPARSDGEAR